MSEVDGAWQGKVDGVGEMRYATERDYWHWSTWRDPRGWEPARPYEREAATKHLARELHKLQAAARAVVNGAPLLYESQRNGEVGVNYKLIRSLAALLPPPADAEEAAP